MTTSTFLKPFARGRAGRGAAAGQYPYPAAVFLAHDVFEVILLDGGAFFHTIENIGSAAGNIWLEQLAGGPLLEDWTSGRTLDWDRAFDERVGGPCGLPIEKHVWLNRLYFLLPVAQAFFRTREERWAATWLRYLKSWSAAHPYRRGADFRTGKALWHDMQVTWRLLVLIHSLFLLGRSKSLRKSDWSFIYRQVARHAQHMHWEAARELAENRGKGNHFLQKGTALLYAGLLFPELPGAAQWVQTGRSIVKQQLDAEIYADGGSAEASPSYSHFIARLHLDAFLLLQNNAQPPIPGLREKLRRQYEFLAATAAPDGKTLQLSDSYAMDADKDIAVVREVLPAGVRRRPAAARQSSSTFADSGFVVLRAGPLAVYIDAMPFGPGHIHDGKPNVLAFIEDQPLLIDSGACSYDDPWHSAWYRSGPAHNAVIITPAGQDWAPNDRIPSWRRTVVPKLTLERADARSARIRHTFDGPGLSYVWVRQVQLTERALTVTDRIIAPAAVSARQFWHFAQLPVGIPGGDIHLPCERQASAIVARAAGRYITLRPVARGRAAAAAAKLFALDFRPAVGADNRIINSLQVASAATGRDITLKVRFTVG